MKWEIPLLLGFFLLFSLWFQFPASDDFSYIDSDGIKHHVAVSTNYETESFDELSYLFSIKYESPWDNSKSTFDIIGLIILVGISIIILRESITFSKANPRFSSRL